MRAWTVASLVSLSFACSSGDGGPRTSPWRAEVVTRRDATTTPATWSAEVVLHDPGCVLGSVTVSGPGLAPVAPPCDGDVRRATAELGSIRPDGFPTYEWRVDATGEVTYANVVCWQDLVAQPIDPANALTNPASLQWTGVEGRSAGAAAPTEYRVIASPDPPPSDPFDPVVASLGRTTSGAGAGPFAATFILAEGASMALRVFAGPPGWLSGGSSCYSVSPASRPFTVLTPQYPL